MIELVFQLTRKVGDNYITETKQFYNCKIERIPLVGELIRFKFLRYRIESVCLDNFEKLVDPTTPTAIPFYTIAAKLVDD